MIGPVRTLPGWTLVALLVVTAAGCGNYHWSVDFFPYESVVQVERMGSSKGGGIATVVMVSIFAALGAGVVVGLAIANTP